MGWLELPTDAAAKASEEEDGVVDSAAFEKIRSWFEEMPNAFRPEEAKKVKAIFQMEIFQGDEELVWHYIIKDQTCTGIEGPAEKPSVVIRSSAKDWIDMAEGRLGGMKAFLSGKLKATGKWRLITKFDKLFETNS